MHVLMESMANTNHRRMPVTDCRPMKGSMTFKANRRRLLADQKLPARNGTQICICAVKVDLS